jgi:hypothetical protein
MNFARSSRLFVLIGILAIYAGRGEMVVGLAGLFSIGLGMLLGILSLFGVGRPANELYKAPWITLSLGCLMLLFVGLGAMSAALRGRAQADGPTTAPFIDRINGFRLDDPGEGWKILAKDEIRKFNEDAVAGAQCGPNLGGMVVVETPDPDFRIAGREQEVGKEIVDEIEMDDKRVVFIRPDELDGQKAVRCQVVGKIAGRGIRYEDVALIANGRLYRLTAVGPSDQTSDDGLAFRPFMAAFHVVPPEPQEGPPVPAAPSARK